MQTQDHVFIVTGAASGLGAATARRLVQNGARVVLADVNEAAGQAVAAELGDSARFVHTDVTDEASAQACITAAVETFGAVHGLVNCAGICPAEKVVGRDGVHRLETFTRVIQINLIGTFNMLRLAAEAMVRNAPNADGERGVIVNTASISAYDGQMGQAAYSASKGGVAGMTLPIARDLARNGIRVMAIAPGIMETPMVSAMPAEVQASLGAMVPFPARLGRPTEYAHLVQTIVENPYLNGEVIRIDGAVRMAAK